MHILIKNRGVPYPSELVKPWANVFPSLFVPLVVHLPGLNPKFVWHSIHRCKVCNEVWQNASANSKMRPKHWVLQLIHSEGGLNNQTDPFPLLMIAHKKFSQFIAPTSRCFNGLCQEHKLLGVDEVESIQNSHQAFSQRVVRWRRAKNPFDDLWRFFRRIPDIDIGDFVEKHSFHLKFHLCSSLMCSQLTKIIKRH